ncbi:MAG: choline kinase [Hyphomicrobiales bacterium]|nr:MAG: choline kinase [Hyphomicrobiales bacterium]
MTALEVPAAVDIRVRSLPIWQGDLSWEVLKGGLSNTSYMVGDGRTRVVVRLGEDYPFHHVYREREVMASKAAAHASFAPEVLDAAPGVMVSRFIDGKTYSGDDVRANIDRVATLVRRFHTEMPGHVSGAGFIFWVFAVIRDYAHTLTEGGSRLAERMPEFVALAESLEALQVPLPIVYGHHDLLPANLIDDGEKLWLIDFEYAGFGTAMFDLAGLASNAGFSQAEAEHLLGVYFDRTPDANLIRSHAAMQCASLLREAMWSMVSELYLNAPGADYVAYTAENLAALEASLDAYQTRFGKV